MFNKKRKEIIKLQQQIIPYEEIKHSKQETDSSFKVNTEDEQLPK